MSEARFKIESIPQEMKASRRWLVWRALPADQDGKVKKVPFDFRTGKACDPTDPAVLGTFEEVVAACATGGYSGIGFVLGQDGHEFWSGIDLDGCVSADGTVTPDAMAIVGELNSYTEQSVSDGLHILIKGPTGGNHVKAGLEIYGEARYFTVTGRHLAGTPTEVELRAIEVRAVIDREFGQKVEPRRSKAQVPTAIDKGSRNDTLFREACRLRERGHSEEEIKALLVVMNRDRVSPPLPLDEVSKIAHSAGRYQAGSEEFVTYESGSRKGQIVADNQKNIRVGLDLLGLKLRYNAFANKALAVYDGATQPLDDALLHRSWLMLDERYKFRPSIEFFQIVVGDLARRDTFHPVRDYLMNLTWDRTPRVDHWLTTYGGAADSEFIRAVGAIFLIAAVRRVLSPGVKYDELLIFESGQGTLKSSALRGLCPVDDWFSDDLPLGVDAKVLIERTAGKWIIEASEMQGYNNSEIDRLKGMLARQVDGPVRLSYGRMSVEVPRQFVLAGTTNQLTEYLRDSTGNRRFWPVRVQQFDLAALKRDRDQLWAEAVFREALNESIRLPESLWSLAAHEQEARRQVDPWEELLDDSLDGGFDRDAILVNELWNALGDAGRYYKRNDADRLQAIVQRRGFTRKKKIDVVDVYDDGRREQCAKRKWAWVREGSDPVSIEVRAIDRREEVPY